MSTDQVNNTESNSASSIFAAVFTNDETELFRLLDAKAFVNAQDEEGWTALNFAAHLGLNDIVKKLITRYKADPNIPSSSGLCPIHRVVVNAEDELLRWLIIEGNADVNAQSNYGDTSLHLAVSHGRLQTVKLLLEEYYADPTILTNDGRSAVDIAKHMNRAAILDYITIFQQQHKDTSPLIKFAGREQ